MPDLTPYVVRQGDHLARIAFEQGFDAEMVWNHPKNAELRESRRDSGILLPGDILLIPTRTAAGPAVEMESNNELRARVPDMPLLLRVDALLQGRSTACHVEGALAPVPEEVAADGTLSLKVPVTAREIKITLPALGVRLVVRPGGLDPIDQATGLAQRLQNLGFLSPEKEDTDDGGQATALAVALRRFQAQEGLPESGQADDATRAKLRERSGC